MATRRLPPSWLRPLAPNAVPPIERAWLWAVLAAVNANYAAATLDDADFKADAPKWAMELLNRVADIQADTDWLRKRLVILAVENQVSLRDVARAAHVSHQTVRRWSDEGQEDVPPASILWHVGLDQTDPPDEYGQYDDEPIDPVDHLIRLAGIDGKTAEHIRFLLASRISSAE